MRRFSTSITSLTTTGRMNCCSNSWACVNHATSARTDDRLARLGRTMTCKPVPGTQLSRREHEVLLELSAGKTYGQAGAELGITASSVGCIAMRAMARTRTSSLFALGMWAQRNGYGPDRAPVFSQDQCNCGPGCDGRGCAAQVNA